jgi:hypothetical protein
MSVLYHGLLSGVLGLAALLCLRRLFQLGEDVVILTRQGVTDRRNSRQEIPWSAIESIKTQTINGFVKSIHLQVKPQEGRRRVKRVHIGMTELDVKFKPFCQLLQTYWNADRNKAADVHADGPNAGDMNGKAAS